MANDPVLQRSMFQKQGPSVTPAVGLGTGIGSVTTPDQNAQALRNMFQPTVSIGAPTEMLQQPVQSFQEGGLARLLPQYNFREPRNFRMPPSYAERAAAANAAESFDIDDAEARSRFQQPVSQFRRDLGRLLPSLPTEESVRRNAEEFGRVNEARRKSLEEGSRAIEEFREASPGSAFGDYFRSLSPEELRSRAEARSAAEERLRSEGARIGETFARENPLVQRAEIEGIVRRQAIDEADERTIPRRGTAPSRGLIPPPEERTEPPPPTEESKPPRDNSLQLTLKEIKAEREADRRQNAYLALMQAGLAIAGGRSPNALTNIGAGGQAGIGAFAAMERASREDAAARRRDAIQLDTAKQQLALSERQLEKEPETIRTFRVLGGGDVMKGFEIFNADKKLQAAVAITKDITSSEEDKRAANEYIRGQLTKARTGGGSFSGFSATPVR